jgi:hypothetical protein
MTCNEKKVYESRKEAKKASELMFLKKGYKLTVYRCSDCPFWHLTSFSKAKSKSFEKFKNKNHITSRKIPYELTELRRKFQKNK